MKTEVSLKKFMEAKRKELQRLNNAYSNTLGNASVEKLVGRGKLVDPHTVDIGGKKYTAKYICIAVGGLPNLIKIPGAPFFFFFGTRVMNLWRTGGLAAAFLVSAEIGNLTQPAWNLHIVCYDLL
jgi:pyruvate/2-oxoglutarate dehydrogenase complex dihydrolipoamide dehydrogenase (E3) component